MPVSTRGSSIVRGIGSGRFRIQIFSQRPATRRLSSISIRQFRQSVLAQYIKSGGGVLTERVLQSRQILKDGRFLRRFSGYLKHLFQTDISTLFYSIYFRPIIISQYISILRNRASRSCQPSIVRQKKEIYQTFQVIYPLYPQIDRQSGAGIFLRQALNRLLKILATFLFIKR